MASLDRQEIPSDQEPTQHEIVVAGEDSIRPDTAEVSPEESTVGSSQQQCTRSNSDRPASRQGANARDEEPDDAPREGDPACPQSTAPNSSALKKPARSRKAKNVYCNECTERKTQPSTVGRGRRNARWRCPECAKLKDQAPPSRRQGRPGRKATPTQAVTAQTARQTWETRNGKTPEADRWKQWMLASSSNQQQQNNSGFNPGTDSDDPDDPPKPIANLPLTDRFGQRKDYSESIRQIQENRSQWNAQPPVAAAPQPDFYGPDGKPVFFNDGVPEVPGVPAAFPAPSESNVSSSLPRPTMPSGNPIQTPYPAGLMGDPLQVAEEPGQPPPRFEDYLRAMPDPPNMTSAPSRVTVTASGPRQQHHGGRPVAYAPRPDFLGVPSRRNEIQVNADLASPSQYPDPTEFEMTGRRSYFDNAMEDIAFSNDCEAVRRTARAQTNFPSNFGASSSSSWFDSYGYQRHRSPRPDPIDPNLTGRPWGFAPSQQPASGPATPSGSGAPNNDRNNGEPDEEARGQAMFD